MKVGLSGKAHRFGLAPRIVDGISPSDLAGVGLNGGQGDFGQVASAKELTPNQTTSLCTPCQRSPGARLMGVPTVTASIQTNR